MTDHDADAHPLVDASSGGASVVRAEETPSVADGW
jgi:hypothetical protein